MLLQLTNLEDGFDATANLWNERFAKIANVLNGHVDGDNLALESVGREHLQPGSVSSDKLAITKDIDENGWTVTDYGTTKSYRYEKTGNLTIAASAGVALFDIPLPVGITNIDNVYLDWSARQKSQEVIYIVSQTPAGQNKDRIYVRAYNTINVALNAHPYVFNFVIEPKA